MIEVTFIKGEKNFPIFADFNGDHQRFTKKAAIELKNKLQLALDDLDVFEAMRESPRTNTGSDQEDPDPHKVGYF